MSINFRVLLVDDDTDLMESFGDVLELKGYQVSKAVSGEQALKQLGEGPVCQLAVVDLKLPGMQGIEVVKRIRAEFRETTVMVLTGNGTVGNAVEAMKLGAKEFLQKPVNPEELCLIIGKVREHQQVVDQNAYFMKELADRYKLENIVGQTPAMLEVYDKIRLVADSDASVLITGENGTGKDLVANHIHFYGARKKGLLVPISCAALTETLFSSELFGHKRGSFTGATEDRVGRFKLADGGTIFLDEVGDIKLDLQTKLLRVLQTREFEPVGWNERIHSDFRLISATHHNLLDDVKNGAFREDLMYRINVVEIKLPPLRARKEDIPLLVAHFIKYFAKKTGKPIHTISDEALAALSAYHWPGNVRELGNAIDHAFVYCPDPVIGLQHLPDIITKNGLNGPMDLSKLPLRSLDAVEKAMVELCLKETGWNISKAAKMLGITRGTLHSKAKRHSIPLSQLRQE